MSEFGAHELKVARSFDWLGVNLSSKLIKLVWRELSSPALIIELLLAQAVKIRLQASLQIIEGSASIKILHCRANLKGLSSILKVAHCVVT